MKRFICLFAVIAILSACSNTSVVSNVDTSMIIDDAKAREMDTVYQDAIHSDTARAVFKSEADQQKMVLAFQEFMKGLGPFLKEHHFRWDEPTTCWNKMYVDKDGHIEYYNYDFKTPVDKEKEEQFKQLLVLYIQAHKMPISADLNYSQCGTVVFMD